MDEFIILRRIAKNSEEYILQVLELTTSQRVPVYYSRTSEDIRLFTELDEDVIADVVKNFVDYESSEPLISEFIYEALTLSYIDISGFKVHKFDRRNKISLRRFNYSFKNSKTLFIPCCGKHKDHEEIKKSWGKYINNFEISPEIFIEGYQVYDSKAFDEHITGIGPAVLEMRYIGNSGILLKEFLDYVDSCIPFTEVDPELMLRYPSGREITLERS